MKRALRDGAIFLGITALVWFVVLRQVSPAEIRAAAAGADGRWLAVAIGAMALYFFCEAWNTRRGLRHLGYTPRFRHCLQYSATGFFFSSVTPSCTGGQPMQLCAMHRHGVSPAHGGLVLLLELCCWQAVGASLGVFGLIYLRHHLTAVTPGVKLLALIGIALNLFALSVITAAMVRPGWAMALGNKVAKKLEKRPKASKVWGAIQHQLEQYALSAPMLRKEPKLVILTFFTTAVQLLTLYSVPYWVFRAMGLTGVALVSAIAAQAAVSFSVGAMPLPGSMGVGEGGFLAMFRLLLPAQLLGGAMVLSRGVSLYLCVIVTGLILLVQQLVRRCRTAA